VTERRVLFFGDSFVAGAGDPTALGWVGRVSAAAHAAGLPLTPYNLGVRGQTSVEVAHRWQSEAWPRLFAQASISVVLSVGANDAVDSAIAGEPRVSPTRSVGALAGMLDEAQALELPAFVVGPPPVGERLPDDRLVELTAAFAELCATRGVPFVPVVEPLLGDATWRAECAAGDGAHPAAGGYAALARLVLDGGFLDWLRAR
jgi:acyl-CoA thioesterase-1